jgi:hypothetical protein
MTVSVVVLPGAGETLESLDAVGRAEHIFDNALLRVVEMLVPVGNGDCLRARKDRLDLIFPLTHPMKNFPLAGDGFGSGELTARNPLVPFDDLEFPGGQAGVKMVAHLVMGNLPHAAPESVADQRTFINHRFALEVLVAGKSERFADTLN